MPDLKTDYLASLESNEAAAQTFLEEHTELFHFPFYIGECIQWDAIISKFPLDTGLITDFAYITRHSYEIDLVLIEIEQPSKKIFLPDHTYNKMTEEFNAADAQLRTWRSFVEQHREVVIEKFARLLNPAWLRMSKVKFKYALIYGRESELAGRDDKRRALADHARDDVEYLTFDSLWNRYRPENRKRNVMRLEGLRYTFKHLNVDPDGMFAYVEPRYITLSAEHEAKLKADGYDVDAWKGGELLTMGGRQPYRDAFRKK